MKRRRNRHAAFSLAEVLIALALLAALLASVAVALHASMKSYTENDHTAQLSQAGRTILMRLHREVRTADDVDSSTSSLTITPPDDGSGLTEIQYELVNGQLHYRRVVSGVTTDQVLLGDGLIAVDAFTVLREDSAIGVPMCVKVHLQMSLGDQTQSLTSSANLRRNQSY